MNTQPLWDWMNERHSIYLRRQQGLPREQWTQDPIFKEYAFCNVFRELDRVTIWVREHIREPYADHPNLWFMLAIARTINWPPTLQTIMDADLWPVGEKWSAQGVADLMGEMGRNGEKVYTGAYMIRAESDPNNIWYSRSKHEYITHCVLGNLWEKRAEFNDLFDHRWSRGEVAMVTATENSLVDPRLEDVWRWILPHHGWGPFMAYEVVTDLRWTRYLDTAPDIMTWANAGPGALRGLNRLLGRDKNTPINPTEATRLMRKLLDLANGSGVNTNYLPLNDALYRWRGGDPQPLEMRDIEHSLCEVDKYLRVHHGEGRPRAKFRPTSGK